jgi:hypothetical protein
MLQRRDENNIPLYSRYDPKYQDPWSAYRPKRSYADNFFRPYSGIGDNTAGHFEGSANYNALQVAVRRGFQHGFSYNVAYTFSKSMSSSPSPYFPDKLRNYGPAGTSPHILTFSYVYQLPGLGKRLDIRPLGWITDNWTVSGITSLSSRPRTTVGCCSWTGTTTANPAPEMTGSEEGARINVLGVSSIPQSEVTFERTFNTAAFGPPQPCSLSRQDMSCFGNAGGGSYLFIPTGQHNWDITLAKTIPLGGERRQLTFRAEMYNFPNHTQFSGVDTSPTFNVNTGALSDTQFGRFTSARAPRQMAMTLRFQF